MERQNMSSANEHAQDAVFVGADWLAVNMADSNLRVIDARLSDPRLPFGYRMGHIPGAIPFDLARDAYAAAGGRLVLRSADELAGVFGARGVSNESTIVIYDENTGPLAATVYWILRYLGHRRLHALEGGWHAWRQAGYEISSVEPKHPVAVYEPHLTEDERATAEWIQDSNGRQDVLLLDARSEGEYVMGHIAGALNWSFEEALDYRTQGIRPAEELRVQLTALGVTPDKEIVTYCQSGSRSAHTYMVLQALGYPRVRNYDGSIMDWEAVRGLPLE